ncbi:MAG: nucleoside-diphosphate kinase [Treponema sp.]|nr:nucleoside-diphosphate kinase [Treponema sp.]
MKTSLSYVLVTPRAVEKNGTGGILSRLLSRTSLDLAGAQILAADRAFATRYADALRKRSAGDRLADYAERNLAADGEPRRSLLLLFRGEDPCGQLARVCGQIRDTYGDLVFSPENPREPAYFEPAVLTAESQGEADGDLRMMADFLDGRENLAGSSGVERTLVILKPDNWIFHSSRPGAIIDMFSATGLRIVGAKIHRFSLAQALDFYGPVEAILKKKLSGVFGKRARALLEREFGFAVGEETAGVLSETFGADCAANEFGHIVEFMSGKRPGTYTREETEKPGDVKCMILIYEGENAVAKIRDALGPTNPADAPDGTVRREFGQSVMVNTAHASDSEESFLREKGIVGMDENTLGAIIREYLG